MPPEEIAANRSQLASLVSSNIIGQNNAAIAATEAQYGEMWAQDALAMDTYAASSAAASKLTPYTEPPQTTNTAGTAAQSAAVAQAAATQAGSSAQTAATAAASTGSPLLQWLANLSTDYTDTLNGLLNSLFGPSGASTYTALYNAVKVPLGFTTGFNDVGPDYQLPGVAVRQVHAHSRVRRDTERGSGRRTYRTLVASGLADQLGLGGYGQFRHFGGKAVSSP